MNNWKFIADVLKFAELDRATRSTPEAMQEMSPERMEAHELYDKYLEECGIDLDELLSGMRQIVEDERARRQGYLLAKQTLRAKLVDSNRDNPDVGAIKGITSSLRTAQELLIQFIEEEI